jgi:hypothetical protein
MNQGPLEERGGRLPHMAVVEHHARTLNGSSGRLDCVCVDAAERDPAGGLRAQVPMP